MFLLAFFLVIFPSAHAARELQALNETLEFLIEDATIDGLSVEIKRRDVPSGDWGLCRVELPDFVSDRLTRSIVAIFNESEEARSGDVRLEAKRLRIDIDARLGRQRVLICGQEELIPLDEPENWRESMGLFARTQDGAFFLSIKASIEFFMKGSAEEHRSRTKELRSLRESRARSNLSPMLEEAIAALEAEPRDLAIVDYRQKLPRVEWGKCTVVSSLSASSRWVRDYEAIRELFFPKAEKVVVPEYFQDEVLYQMGGGSVLECHRLTNEAGKSLSVKFLRSLNGRFFSGRSVRVQ